jgi:hypothetical protein
MPPTLHSLVPVEKPTNRWDTCPAYPGRASLRKDVALDHRRWLLQIRNQPSPEAWQGGDNALSVALVTVSRKPDTTGPATGLCAHLVDNNADFSNAPTDPIFGDSAGVAHRSSRRQDFDRSLDDGAAKQVVSVAMEPPVGGRGAGNDRHIIVYNRQVLAITCHIEATGIAGRERAGVAIKTPSSPRLRSIFHAYAAGMA